MRRTKEEINQVAKYFDNMFRIVFRLEEFYFVTIQTRYGDNCVCRVVSVINCLVYHACSFYYVNGDMFELKMWYNFN